MDLQPLEDEAPLHRDVALLLKCAKSVNWVIKAHGVIGRLDVVVSWQHDSRQKLPTQKNILFFFFNLYRLRFYIVLSHITVAYKSCHRQRCHHFAPVTKEFVTLECVLNWRLVRSAGEGGDNRLGGTVKFHRGGFRDCHHIQRARGWSTRGIAYFQSQGYRRALAAHRAPLASHQS